MNPQTRYEIFKRLAKSIPEPETELEYETPYQLLVAVVLSAQATDKGVNIATRPLFKKAPTPEQMVKLGLEGITEAVKTIGLFRTKAKNVLALSELLIAHHGSQVPDDRDALEALPGVGRKTANVILNTIFGHPTIAVDTHIFRFANRTRIAPGKDVRAVEDKLIKVVPKDFLVDAHHLMILHGRYVCKARTPECFRCVINDLCEFKEKNLEY
ncbi:MAG TPA: endonuclease III [Rhodocyclaceae bacterium]|nr:endonuclease III [Rhodocyclaceae bacterium]